MVPIRKRFYFEPITGNQVMEPLALNTTDALRGANIECYLGTFCATYLFSGRRRDISESPGYWIATSPCWPSPEKLEFGVAKQ
jgi:hypothetical protein